MPNSLVNRFTNPRKLLQTQGLQVFFRFMRFVLDIAPRFPYNVCIMSKHRSSSAAIERETVADYLARGGRITRVTPSLPNDLVRLSESEVIDVMLGASYDDLFGPGVSRFYASAETVASIREEQDHQTVENEYAE